MKSETVKSIEILTASFIINLLYGGATRLASVFFVASIYRYETNRKQASFPYVLAYMMRNLCGPIQGYLQQIFGMKSLVLFGNIVGTLSIGACFFAEDILTVTILWGVVFGFCFGLGTQYLPSLLNAHFTTNRSKANGFSYSGACFGGFMFPPIIDACIDYYGLSGAFLILAAIMAHLIPFSFLLKSPETKLKHQSPNRRDEIKIEMKEDKQTITPLMTTDQIETTTMDTDLKASNQEVIKTTSESSNVEENENVKTKLPSIFTLENFKIFIDPSFLIMFIMTGGSTFVITTMWTIILDFVRDKGVGVNLEIYYVMIMPLADIFGRIGSGFIIDKKFLPTEIITLICFVGTGLTLLALHFTHNYILLMLVECLFPLFYGSILILQIALIHEFIQPERRTMAMVCRAMLYAPLSLGTSPMIGYFRGELGSYDGVIYTLTAISFFCGIIIYFVPHLARKRQSTVINVT